MADAHSDADLPPEPTVRHITPAPEDFEHPPAIPNLLWPLLWTGIAAVLWIAASSLGWVESVAH